MQRKGLIVLNIAALLVPCANHMTITVLRISVEALGVNAHPHNALPITGKEY